MKTFSLRFFAFCVVPNFLLFGYAAPPEVPILAKHRTDTTAVNSTVIATPKKPEPSTNISRDVPTSNKTRAENTAASAVTTSEPTPLVTHNATSLPTAASAVTTSEPTPLVTHNATSLPTSTVPGKSEMNPVKNENVTVTPHHRKPHTTLHPTRSPVTVPVNPARDSENVLEDVALPSHSRPLRVPEKFNPTFGAIVAAICFTTAVGGYIILMVWRKRQIDRYGARQMLINEDDFGDIQDEDMRHFEASCIQIDA